MVLSLPLDAAEGRQYQDLVGTFSGVARRYSDRVALVADGRQFSYRQLDEWSDGVADALQASGVRPGERVALRMGPGAEAIAAILGILKSGAAYVPLDIRNPPARTELILSDSGASAFVGDQGEITHDLTLITTADIARLYGRHTDRPDRPDRPDRAADDIAYVIYTSGTTGAPKGVPVSHRNVTTLFSATAGFFEFSPDDRWLLFHSLAFDFSVWEIWGAFSFGGALVVLPHWAARTPEQYLAVIEDQGITVLNQTPTAFVALTEAALRGTHTLPALRYIVFGGEKLTSAMLLPWARRYGLDQPRLVNGYGITETTVFTTFHQVGDDDRDREVSVIGAPLPGFGFRVVDDDGRDVAVGDEGELWLSGPQVAVGYLNRPDLNAVRFPSVAGDDGPIRYYRSGDLVSELPNGELAYRGRADLQVKLRGYRIELSDIEAVVRTHDDVVDAVVWVREYRAGDARLVCAFVPAAGTCVGARDVREHIRSRLPSYMHPSQYRSLPELPRTINGKTDRSAVAKIWEEGH